MKESIFAGIWLIMAFMLLFDLDPNDAVSYVRFYGVLIIANIWITFGLHKLNLTRGK